MGIRPAWVMLVLALPLVAHADPRDAAAWLERMSEAMRNLNYQGTFVYLHDNQLESMRIVHARDGQGERERLLSLNGEAREILRDEHYLTCIWPGTQSVVVDKARQATPLPAWTSETLAGLEPHYRLELGDSDRIAGMPAQRIDILPKDQYRYGYRMWLDTDSALLLKSDMLDETGQVVEQVMFTSLEIVEDPGALDLNPPEIAPTYRWYERSGETELLNDEAQAWNMQMPQGFRLDSNRVVGGEDDPAPVQQMVLTDGLASVSVFIEPLIDNEPRLQGISHMGAVNAFGSLLPEHHVTVVGEVPPATVELLGSTIRPAGGLSVND
jgi:sigma-E factor negative regulatory protein RseB